MSRTTRRYLGSLLAMSGGAVLYTSYGRSGSTSAAIAWMFGNDPHQVIHEDLARFKTLMEAEVVPETDAPMPVDDRAATY